MPPPADTAGDGGADDSVDNDLLQSELSADTLAALKQHLQSQQTQQSDVEPSADKTSIFSENFGMSQFWYTDATSQRYVDEIYSIAEQNKLQTVNVVCISCPSIFYALDKYIHSGKVPSHITVNSTLLEYDRRFAAHFPTQFHYYDYNEPTALPDSMFHTYDIVIADPPYITESCMSQVGVTMQLLGRTDRQCYMIYNTGYVLRQAIEDILDLKCCVFEPAHRVGLMNQFATYTNYNSKLFGGWRTD